MCDSILKEGDSLANVNSLALIRENITNYIGKNVKLRADKGRKRIMIKEGIIENTYPSIFVVKVKGDFDNERRISYSYSDVLTSAVQLSLYEENEEIENEMNL